MARPKRDLFRITVNLPVHILELVDNYAKEYGISRTTAITYLLAQSLAQDNKE